MMIQAGSLRTGVGELPTMDLTFEAIIERKDTTFYASGSSKDSWLQIGGILPCDVAPLTDAIAMGQSGQIDVASHIIHFGAGTNVQARDSVQIVGSRSGFGPIGQWFYLTEVLLPSEIISYVRCRAMYGKQPTAGGEK